MLGFAFIEEGEQLVGVCEAGRVVRHESDRLRLSCHHGPAGHLIGDGLGSRNLERNTALLHDGHGRSSPPLTGQYTGARVTPDASMRGRPGPPATSRRASAGLLAPRPPAGAAPLHRLPDAFPLMRRGAVGLPRRARQCRRTIPPQTPLRGVGAGNGAKGPFVQLVDPSAALGPAPGKPEASAACIRRADPRGKG